MNGKHLYEFYEKVLLPQFGIKGVGVEWASSKEVGPDEVIHYFSVRPDNFALIFEDYGGVGSTKQWVLENVNVKNGKFEYVSPTSYTEHSPSYPIKFPTPFQYCVNVTGMFTLVKL
jgi:hypothetical protein